MTDFSIITTLGFIATTFATLWMFSKAVKQSKIVYGILCWMLLVGVLGVLDFYKKENVFPPRVFFLLVPTILLFLYLFINKNTQRFLDGISLKWLTLLHVIRIPVELVLLNVFLEGLIPRIMTFEGWNYDILSGITAPIMYYGVFVKKRIGTRGLLLWNSVCLVLLVNIVTIAILSAKTPLQQLAFEQPNVGITCFPLVWLPAVVVPIVLFSHLVAIRQLLKKK